MFLLYFRSKESVSQTGIFVSLGGVALDVRALPVLDMSILSEEIDKNVKLSAAVTLETSVEISKTVRIEQAVSFYMEMELIEADITVIVEKLQLQYQAGIGYK